MRLSMSTKNKAILFLISLIITCSLFFSFNQVKKYRSKPNNSFKTGERLEYRLHYGMVNAGEAILEVDPQYYAVNDRVCYKINVLGRSTGSFDFFMKIKDQFISYVDTGALVPQKFCRSIREGKYKLDETVYFDQLKSLSVTKRNDDGETVNLIPKNVQDLVSGYYYLRTVNFEQQKIGDTTNLAAFFEGKNYDFKIKFLGKEVINSKFGKIQAYKLSPIMPENEMFKGGNSIGFWISADKNRVPLKVEAIMFVGSVDLDLKGYSGLKWPLAIVN